MGNLKFLKDLANVRSSLISFRSDGVHEIVENGLVFVKPLDNYQDDISKEVWCFTL